MNNTQPMESLESRTLMSATPTLFSPAVRADRVQIHADLIKLRTDLFNDARSLQTDNKALHQDKLRLNTTLAPLVSKLRTDYRGFSLTLKGDRLNEAGNVIADEKVILTDLKQFIADKGNPNARATDVTKLTADRVTLQNDMVAGLTQRITDRQTETTALMADEQVILTALPTSGASAKLMADVTVWLDAKGASLSNITADLQKLSGDRTHLITDLGAG